jgi:non-specific serine/threonine protein kinase
LTHLLDLAGPDADPRARGRIRWVLGLLAFWAGDPGQATAGWQESLRLGRTAADPIVLVASTGMLATVEQVGGDGQAADSMLAELLADRDVASDARARTHALYYRGYLAINRGELAFGERLLHEGATVGRAAGDLFALAHLEGTLGHAAMLSGDLERAREHLVQALGLRRNLKSLSTVAFTVEKLGWLAALAGDARHAAHLLGAAAAMRARTGSEIYPYEVAGHDEAVRTARMALGNARFEAVYADGRSMAVERAVELALQSRPASPPTPDGTPDRAPTPLSRRAWQIAQLVARGLTNRQIADNLVLQESTVGNHLQRIYARLELSGRAQLATWVSEHYRAADPSTG